MRDRFPLQLSLHLTRPLEMARERPNDIYNLYYDDLVADPLAQMKKVYAWLGDEWTEATQMGMRRLAARQSAEPIRHSTNTRSPSGASQSRISSRTSRTI